MTTILGLQRAQKITPILGSPTSGVASVLLYGPRGCGKSLLVAKLAEAWLSQDGSHDRAIDSFRRGANPDYFVIEPMGLGSQITLPQISPAKTKTKANENITPLTEFLRVGPLYSRHKVIWINEAERMNLAAINSLLKPLEEPPPYAKIILTTSQISQIPATILSRCLVINCELPTEEELGSIYRDIPSQVIELAEGAPGTLERIAQNPDLYIDIVAFADRLAKASKYQTLVLSEEYRKLADRFEAIEKVGIRNANARTLELVATAIAKRHPNPELIHAVAEGHRRILANANPALVLDAMIGRITLAKGPGTIRP